MANERKNFMNKAKKWVDDYNQDVKPFIKNNFVYSPLNVARLCQEVSSLTFYVLTFEMFDNYSEEEKQIQVGLQKAGEEIMDILQEMQPEYDAFAEDMDRLQEELNREPIDMEEQMENMETIGFDDEAGLLN